MTTTSILHSLIRRKRLAWTAASTRALRSGSGITRMCQLDFYARNAALFAYKIAEFYLASARREQKSVSRVIARLVQNSAGPDIGVVGWGRNVTLSCVAPRMRSAQGAIAVLKAGKFAKGDVVNYTNPSAQSKGAALQRKLIGRTKPDVVRKVLSPRSRVVAHLIK